MTFSPLLMIGVLLLVLVVTALLYLLKSMFLATRGRNIAGYDKPQRALLVLDIQESGSRRGQVLQMPTGTPFGRMLETVNRMIELFEASGQEIAYVRQVFANCFLQRLHGGRIVAGQLQPVICRWVKVVNNNDFAKNRTDAFSNKELEQFLIAHQVSDLYLVGLDAAYCVYYTARGARNRGYRVTVISDAVMSGKPLAPVLDKYRRAGIAVQSSEQVAAELAAALQSAAS